MFLLFDLFAEYTSNTFEKKGERLILWARYCFFNHGDTEARRKPLNKLSVPVSQW